MMFRTEPVYTVPELIREDTARYAEHIDHYLNGDLSLQRLKGYRVPMGVYGQRGQEGQIKDKYMVRVRLPGGVIFREQLARLAELSNEYGAGFVHFTTRQDVQIHQVELEDTPEILNKLLEVGLSPRGGGGNTVRNIANSSRAGVHPKEAFDTTPHALALSEYLLQSPSTYNLPRKYKIAFSSTAEDEALASINDLGFIAREKNGEYGFKIYAAGGMGNDPRTGLLLNKFIAEDKIFQAAEAIKRLFDDLGDRQNKNQARLRFVRKRLGAKEFKKTFNDYWEQVLAEDIEVNEINKFQLTRDKLEEDKKETDINPEEYDFLYPEKENGYYAVDLNPFNGDLTEEDINRILNLVSKFDLEMRSTNRQGLLLRGLKAFQLSDVISSLKQIDSKLVFKNNGLRPIACKGASTCRLGLCLSPALAREIKERLSSVSSAARSKIPRIYISGCPNSCGQHYIGKIGLEGKAKRHEGRLVPFYTLLLGGRIEDEKSRYGKKIIDLPARRVPDFFASLAQKLARHPDYEREDFYQFLNQGGEEFIEGLARDFIELESYQKHPELYKDWGREEDFSLAGRGPGECGTGVMDIIKLDIDTAYSNLQQAQKEENQNILYQAIITGARALLITRGVDTEKDRIVVQEFKNHFIKQNLVSEKHVSLLEQALDYKLGEEIDLLSLSDKVAAFINRIENLYNSLNSSLEFEIPDDSKAVRKEKKETETSNKKENSSSQKPNSEQDKLKDLRGVDCPMNFVKAKLFLEPLSLQSEVTFYLDPGKPIENVSRSLENEGHQILQKEKINDDYFKLVVKKKGEQ